MPTRFQFITLLFVAVSLPVMATAGNPRPNILWITSEDNSPYLGCYGDDLAQTPHLDALAAHGVRYRRAFANAPVCSAARSTLITGMHASSLGVQHHRSKVAIPGHIKLYPETLRAAGYYCTNNVKTDYNVAEASGIWDESSKKAHYKNRPPGQPFFAVFNFTSSHESQVAPKKGKSTFRVAPEAIKLPPYHPDTPEIRRDWANYYDQITLMDSQVGAVLHELEAQGLADSTIVFYYGDHGGALPRGKRSLHDSGTRVPLIIRIPERWASWRPAAPGGWVEDPVCFTDFAATLFSLCEVQLPPYLEGRPFLGPARAPAQDYVFLFRGRMDERLDTSRAIRNREYRYIRNYSPHRPWGQHYSYPFEVQPSMRSWNAAFREGRCNPVQAAYWLPKPFEELYALADDPDEVASVAADPAHRSQLDRLRQTLREEMLRTRDTGFIPEGMFPRLSSKGTIYEYARSDAYPLERILDMAGAATSRDPSELPALQAGMKDAHPIIRYWGATGCLVLGEQARAARADLMPLLSDTWADVRVVAAEAVTHLGDAEAGLKVLSSVLTTGNQGEVLAALNSLDALVDAGVVPRSRAQEMVRPLRFDEPAGRIQKRLLDTSP